MSLLIYGKNSVKSAITSKKAINVYLSKTFKDKDFIFFVNSSKCKVFYKTNEELTHLVNSNNHQGVIAEINEYHYYPLSDLILDGKKISNPIIIMLDGIEDPHNLGAMLRIADAFNVVGIIIKKNSQVPLNATVAKVSTGAINYVKVCEVSNLNQTIRTLKDNGYWIISSDGNAKESYTKLDYKMPLVLVIGSEGKGISSLVKTNSDFLIKIPMYGHVNSLNASNALSVILSHIIISR